VKALRHLVKKEFIQLRRTRSMLAISLGVPIVQLLILGFAITGDVIHVPTTVIDLDNTLTSRSLVSRLSNTRYLDVRRQLTDIRGGSTMLRRGDVIVAVTIPRNFEKKIVRGEQPHILLSADAQNTNVAIVGVGYIRRILLSWATSLQLNSIKAPVTLNKINIDSRIWYNQELKSAFYMVPGILVLLVTIITLLLTALAIVREREVGTLEQLMVTPITRLELILGKTIPFAILGMAELIIALIVGKAVYRFPIAGSLPLFLGVALLYIFCTIGIGIFISTITYTQQQALFTAWFFLIFFILMSGFFLPLENMPKVMYYMTFINPLRYFMTVIRELFLKGATITELAPHIVALTVVAVSVLSAAVIRFNKRLG